MAYTMQALNLKTATFGSTKDLRARSSSRASATRCVVSVRAQQEEVAVARRAALGMLAGAAALIANSNPALAAYGDAARVFGRAPTNKSGFVPYAGDGYALLLPSKWNPSKEKDFKGVDLRYEDNFDAVNNLVVISKPTDKKTITEYGSPEEFLTGTLNNLLGEQVWTGETRSEGGFKAGKVSAASLLDVQTQTDKKGKPYYLFEILTRTADGDEGGRHQLFKAAIGSGNLYILKVQIGDKRWFKGAKKEATGAQESFVVA